ncbi:MAG: 50S ribosomal protein L21 [Myxococcota bacterium]
MYAVVRTGGKQLRVQPGDVVDIERVPAEAGQQIELPEVLLVADDSIRVGTPLIEGARVTATVQGLVKGPKIQIFKHRRRKRYRLHKGHRQGYTRVRIETIEG